MAPRPSRQIPPATITSYPDPAQATAAEDGRRRLQRYLATEDLANLVRARPETVRYWRHTGTGPASFRIGRRVLYELGDVEEWIAAARSGLA